MFKKIILVLALALPLSVFAQKFGTVDQEAIFTALPETKAMQNQLAETSKKYEDEFSKMQENINKLVTDFQAKQNDPTTPESIKQRRQQEIQEAYERAEQWRNTVMQDLEKQRASLMQPILKKVSDAVKSVGTEENFTMIVPNDPGLILYSGKDVIDITPMVKTKLGIK